MPSITDLIPQMPMTTSVGIRALAAISQAVVHHEAIFAADKYDVVSRYQSEARYHISKGWGHISYHLKIARDGAIYQVLPFEQVAYHAGNLAVNKRSIGICLDGDFSKQAPSPAQTSSLQTVMRWLSTQRPDIPKLDHKGFYGHREVKLFGGTYCPGPDILIRVKAFREGKTK